MDKTLKTIQTISKVCKILAEIAFVLLIVLAVILVVAAVGLAAGNTALISAGRADELNRLLGQTGLTMEYMVAGCVVGALFLAAQAVVAKFANVYFKHELKAGTPFTFAGAKEMLRLGIIALAVPVGTSIVCAIVLAVMSASSGVADRISIDVSIGLGVVFLALSPVLKYGAYLAQKAQTAEEAPQIEEDNL